MVELREGDVVDQRYRVNRLIGSGGMATVFEVQDVTSGHRAAMKVLQRQLLLHPVIPQRFLREAQAASALDTPFAVKVESTGNTADGSPYIVMEYLQGAPLNEVIEAEGKFDAERALYLADQVAQGIHDAHQHGIIHRDLKPENIFVMPTQQGDLVKVVDFGISKIFSAEDGVKLTQTGVTVGTPQYMPVEQLRGTKDLDGRVDVYALGVVLFEMFAGVRPYDGFTYEEVILKVATTTAPSLAAYRSDLPPGLVQVVDRAMARERDERIASMAQLRQEMAPYWSGRSPIGVPAAQGYSLAQTGANSVDPLSQTGGQALSQTGGHPEAHRATAGKTQVIDRPMGAPTPPAPPAATLPDHPVSASPAVSAPSPSTPAAARPTAKTGPPKTLIWLLLIVAAGIVGLLVAIGAVALYLFL